MPFSAFEAACKRLIKEAIETPINVNANAVLEQPPAEIEADLAMPCFTLAKQKKKNPVQVAEELEEIITKKISDKSLVERVEAKGPFLNFYINWPIFSELIIKEITEKKEHKKTKDKILLEHTSINPTGPVHVGRLRNSLIGDSLKRLFCFMGHDVETYYYVNDIGKQVAMIVWALENGIKPKTSLLNQFGIYKNKADFKTMAIYTAAYSIMEKDQKKEQEVSGLLQKCERGDKNMLKKFRDVSEKCLGGQKEVLKRMGIVFDHFTFESSFVENKDVKKIIETLDKKNVLKEKDGAFGLDLSEFGLERREGLTILKRSDGTSVYILRDLAYHLEKAKKAKTIINILGEDHRIEFKELKTILEKYLDFTAHLEAVHYAFVSFKGMKLSTRRGQTAPLDMLIDDGTKHVMKKLEESKFVKPSKELAEKIAIAAIKYHILKTDLQKPITFIWDDAISFEGDTGPYLQYTYARAKSIIEKSKQKFSAISLEKLAEKEEKQLIKKLSLFQNIIKNAAEKRHPHVLANYLSELSALFNEFYHKHKVVGSEIEKQRLALVESVIIVLKIGLYLLGIEALEKM